MDKYFESMLFFMCGIAIAVFSYCSGLIIDIHTKK